MSSVLNEIFNQVNDLEIIDSHEHLPYKEEARNKNTDVLQEYLLIEILIDRLNRLALSQ